MHKMVSIVIITLVRESLYPLVDLLLKQEFGLDFEIIIIPQNEFDYSKLTHPQIKIFPYKKDLGLSYYRNEGVKHSSGSIIAFVDDDEIPKNNTWLSHLINPILKDEAEVTTAGTDIPLKQGFLADSISLLGYPGGAALGFKALWDVDENDFTHHLCSGNFAVKKSLFNELGGFPRELKSGTEDVFLSKKLEEFHIPILYVEEATINHLPRTGLLQFMKWHFGRGRAAAEYSRLKLFSTNQFFHLFKTFLKAIKRSFLTPYLFLILILWPLQYFCQAIGMLYNRVVN